MTAKTRIIINADDFGLSSAVNEAVLQAHTEGVLSSATLMANMEGFEEAVRGALHSPSLGIGVHLNILRGKPLCHPSDIPSLVDPQGYFLRSIFSLWKGFRLRRIHPHHVEHELETQIARVIAAGIHPTHLDSEKHLHLFFPELWDMTCRLAYQFHIKHVRVICEPFFLAPLLPPHFRQLLKTPLLNWRSRHFKTQAQKHGLRYPDRFFGIARAGQMTTAMYHHLFRHLPQGTLEIMTHPATRPDAAARVNESSWLDGGRVEEYRALIDPRTKEALVQSSAALIHFGHLS